MKKLLFTAALLTGLITAGFAQQGPQKEQKSPEERARRMTEALEKKLNLTADQKSKVYEINLDRAKKMEAMRRENEKKMAEKMEKRRDLTEESDKKLEKVLTADQLKSYREMQSNMHERMHEHPKGMHKMHKEKKDQ